MKYLKILILLLFLVIMFIIVRPKKNPYKYSKGIVYIGSKEYLDSLDINKNDVLVEDLRNEKNPNMKIRNSYLITDDKDIKDIVKILYNYEKKHPSRWNRSVASMIREWQAHNTLYYLHYKRDHTTDVDLDNNDEKAYK